VGVPSSGISGHAIACRLTGRGALGEAHEVGELANDGLAAAPDVLHLADELAVGKPFGQQSDYESDQHRRIVLARRPTSVQWT
jgi:hypothetical protein